MIQTLSDEQRRSFSHWLRTGRLPRVRTPDGIELKFNPWHDPDDGRFTFAGMGQHFGPGEGGTGGTGGTGQAGSKAGQTPKIAFHDDPAESQIKTKAKADAWRTKNLEKYGGDPDNRRTIEAKYREYLASLTPAPVDPPKPPATSASGPGEQPNRIVEFATGVGEGVYGVAKDTAKAAYSAATTNPATTLSNAEFGIADMIDRAIAAEDTSARVQIAQAANAVANASARDIGRAVGSVAGNFAVAAIPGAAAAKVTWLRRARAAQPRPIYHPPNTVWKAEKLTTKGPSRRVGKIRSRRQNLRAKRYNGAAPGARAEFAPALKRTMPDGSTRLVKFDGIRGDYLIDRKWSVYFSEKSREQALSQSAALAEQKLIGVWELPTAAKRAKAAKFLKEVGIKNIVARVAKP